MSIERQDVEMDFAHDLADGAQVTSTELRALADKMDAEYVLYLKISSYCEYDVSQATFTFYRSETEEEVAGRERREAVISAHRRKMEEECDRQRYLTLKARFEK